MAKRSTARAVPAIRRHDQRLVVDQERRADGQFSTVMQLRRGSSDAEYSRISRAESFPASASKHSQWRMSANGARLIGNRPRAPSRTVAYGAFPLCADVCSFTILLAQGTLKPPRKVVCFSGIRSTETAAGVQHDAISKFDVIARALGA
jgi:hypothetical protein